MRRVFVATATVLIVAFVALGAQSPAAALSRQAWTIDGVERTALVSIPGGSAPTAGWPLVLIFHGHGGSSANAARSFRVHEHWPEAIAVYPQGLQTPGQLTDPEGQRPGWQHVAGDQHDRDLRFIDQILTSMRAREWVDPQRLFATGHSNGGSMVYVLWATRGDHFAAFAPSSSVFLRNIPNAKPKPAFVVAGMQDALVPYASQMRSLQAMLTLNQADPKGTRWDGALEIHRSPIGADVVTYLHSGGHQLPADGGAFIVRFFKSVTGLTR